MKAGLGLFGLILVLTLAEYALAVGGTKLAMARPSTAMSATGAGMFGWILLVGAGGLLACAGIQFRAWQIQKKCGSP